MITGGSARPYTPADGAKDAAWLQTVGALRGWELRASGRMVLETPDRRLHELDAVDVAAFRLGVLVGWLLPRESS